MNKSYMDDEETRQELEEVKRLSIEEILEEPKVDLNHSAEFYNKEDELETTLDFIAVTERMMNPHLSQEEAEKKAIIQMREYYFEGEQGSDYPLIDNWLKVQENKYQIGSSYEEDYASESDQQQEDRREEYSCHAIEYEYDDYRDSLDYTPSDDKIWDLGGFNHEDDFVTGPDLEIHDDSKLYDYPVVDVSIIDMLEE